MSAEFGLYIHLPYCRSLCPYCAFSKAPLHRAEPDRLLRSLDLERGLALADSGAAWTRPRTIYVGGGTPTALGPDDLERFLGWVRASFDISGVREWTVEANPEGLTDAKLRLLRASGVDRLSLGVQSLEPAVLRALGRIHSAEDALEALDRTGRAGFVNRSVDFMVGVPGETASGFSSALERMLDRGVPHISVYGLQIESGTPLERKVTRGAWPPVDPDLVAARYADLADRLGARGYRHYEVSSYALPGFESRHNQGYWTRRPYLGLGPGAHSFDGRSRWRNEEVVARYFERLERGALPREDSTRLTQREAAEEAIFLALRRARGLRARELPRARRAVVQEWARWARDGGAVRLDPPGRIRPTERGLLLAHEVAAELLARLDTGRGGW